MKNKSLSIPITFDTDGMMHIIQQILRDKLGTKMSDEELKMMLTEYGKYWYFRNVKKYKVVDAYGKEAK